MPVAPGSQGRLSSILAASLRLAARTSRLEVRPEMGKKKPRPVCDYCGEDPCVCTWKDRLAAAGSKLIDRSTSDPLPPAA
jgi:hypothetical protein